MKKIVFFTGARSEYGIMSNLINYYDKKKFINNVFVYASGMHFLKNFGNTENEINFKYLKINRKIKIYKENHSPSNLEFTKIINKLVFYFKKDKIDYIFVVGDRIESYAATLAAHFSNIKIFHAGGGNITLGSYDNIYRYNISNLSFMHFATSKNNYKNLVKLNTINKKNIKFTGSLAVDSIYKFLKNKKSNRNNSKTFLNSKYILLSFHPSTAIKEDLGIFINQFIKKAISKKLKIIITYPNNDYNYKSIIKIINLWKKNSHVMIKKNFGLQAYFSIIDNAEFLVGNSSSFLIEAPYFKKIIFNIGDRQKGRERESNVLTLPVNLKTISKIFNIYEKKIFSFGKFKYIFGNGNAIYKISHHINKYLNEK